MNFYENVKKNLKEAEETIDWESALNSGSVVNVYDKSGKYTPTKFFFYNGKVYYKNKAISGGSWFEHPQLNQQQIIKHIKELLNDKEVDYAVGVLNEKPDTLYNNDKEQTSIKLNDEPGGKHYPEGKILREPDMERAKTNVRDWYMEKYPTDDLGPEIKEDLTFEDVFDALDSHKDFYDFIGVGDSIVRERIFEELADIIGSDYDYVYYQWLGESAETDKIKKEIKEYKKVLKGDIPGIERDKYEAKLNNAKKKLKEENITLTEASTGSNKYVNAYMNLSYSMFDGMGDWSNWSDFADVLADDYGIKFNGHQKAEQVVAKGMAIMYEKDPERFKEYVESLIIDNCVNDGYFDYLDSKSHKEKGIVKSLQTLLEYLQNNGGSQEAIEGITNELNDLSNVQTNARQIGEEFQRYMEDHSFWKVMGTNCDYWTNKDLEGLPKEYACFTGNTFNFLLYGKKWTKDNKTENEYGLGYGFKNSGDGVIADLLTYKYPYVDFQQVGNSFEITPENENSIFAKMKRVYVMTANKLKREHLKSYEDYIKGWELEDTEERRNEYKKNLRKMGIKESADQKDIVKSLKDDKDGLRVDVVKAPNKKFFNYYYSSDKDHWDSNAGPFNSEKEAIKMAKKHRPTVKESQIKEMDNSEGLTKEQFIDYCKDKIKNLGTVKVKDFDDNEVDVKVAFEQPIRDYGNCKVLNGEDTMDKLDSDGETIEFVDEKGEYHNSPMVNPITIAGRLEFDTIDKDFYDNIINYWDDVEGLFESASIKEEEEEEEKAPTGLLKAVLDKAEELGWTYDKTNFAGGDVGYEFYQFSPAGEDFSIAAECGKDDLSDDEKGKNLIAGIRDQAEYFDPDEHIEMWIEARNNGVSGVPSTRQLVEDADDIQEMLDEFASGVEKVSAEPINESEKVLAVSSWTFRD